MLHISCRLFSLYHFSPPPPPGDAGSRTAEQASLQEQRKSQIPSAVGDIQHCLATRKDSISKHRTDDIVT